jgi:hypothetical protein
MATQRRRRPMGGGIGWLGRCLNRTPSAEKDLLVMPAEVLYGWAHT